MDLNEELKTFVNELGLDESVVATLNESLTSYVETKAAERAEAILEAKQDEIDEIVNNVSLMQEEAQAIIEKGEAWAEYVKEEVTSRVGDYIDYAVKEFISENTEKFNKLEDYERMSSALDAVKHAFEMNGVHISGNPLAESLSRDLDNVTSEYNELFEERTSLSSDLESAKQTILFLEATRGLTDVEIDKVRELAESVTFNDTDEFAQCLDLIIERVNEKAGTEEVLAEGTKTSIGGEMGVLDPRVLSYLEKMV